MSASAFGKPTPVDIGPNPLEAGFTAWTSPAKLSPKAATAVTLHLTGRISTSDGSRIPALETLSLQFDRAGSIFTKGLPTCSIAELANPIDLTGPLCQDALVGHGKVTAQPYLPEQSDPPIQGPLEIFNGRPVDGHPVLIYRARAHVPALTNFLTSGEILNERGKFGTHTSIRIPKILDGADSLTSFKAQLGRSWSYKGHEVSLLTASCPEGGLAAKAEFHFAGGPTLAGEVEKKCK